MTATFIKAVEFLIPNPARTRLTLKTGHIGELDKFERSILGLQLAYAEGLPSMCRLAGHPPMLNGLGISYS